MWSLVAWVALDWNLLIGWLREVPAIWFLQVEEVCVLFLCFKCFGRVQLASVYIGYCVLQFIEKKKKKKRKEEKTYFYVLQEVARGVLIGFIWRKQTRCSVALN